MIATYTRVAYTYVNVFSIILSLLQHLTFMLGIIWQNVAEFYYFLANYEEILMENVL